MSEENAKDPRNEAAGSTPFQPTEPLPSVDAWQSVSPPQFRRREVDRMFLAPPQGQHMQPGQEQYGQPPQPGQEQPPQYGAGYGQNNVHGQQPVFGYGQQQYAQDQSYGQGQQFAQPQQYSQAYGQGPQYNQSQQFAAPQAPQGGYYDQRAGQGTTFRPSTTRRVGRVVGIAATRSRGLAAVSRSGLGSSSSLQFLPSPWVSFP